MNFMNLIRSISFLMIGWTILALGMGALGLGTPAPEATNFFSAQPSLHDVVEISTPQNATTYRSLLVDRSTGQSKLILPPGKETWGLLSISPWRDRDGNLEAVGRWANLNTNAGVKSTWGLGLVKLPAETVVHQVTLDVLPIGRPCLLPGRRGEVLFPTGDGQLYRCNIGENSRDADLSTISSSDGDRPGTTASARPVVWRCPPPGEGGVFLHDPFWSSNPRLSHLVFVSLSAQELRDGRRSYEPPKLWWLKMNKQGDEILAAGRLTHSSPSSHVSSAQSERFPTIAVSGEGKLRLAYMGRECKDKSWRLQTSDLDLDPKTALPIGIEGPKTCGDSTADLALAPLLVSADGERVFALNATGRIATLALAGVHLQPAH